MFLFSFYNVYINEFAVLIPLVLVLALVLKLLVLVLGNKVLITSLGFTNTPSLIDQYSMVTACEYILYWCKYMIVIVTFGTSCVLFVSVTVIIYKTVQSIGAQQQIHFFHHISIVCSIECINFVLQSVFNSCSKA